MADVNPSARIRTSVFYDGLAADPASGRRKPGTGMRLNSYFFADIDDDDDILIGQRGVVAVAWQANTTGDRGAVGVITTSSLTHIRFQTDATDPDGWIHVLSRGTQQFSDPTQDETQVARGTAGYLQQGSIYLNPKAASPNILTTARAAKVNNLRMLFAPFTTPLTSGDRWRCATGTRGTDTLCSGIAAIAWQSATAADTTDMCAPTLDASGDVIFNATGATPAGYLWIWKRG